VSRLLVVTAVDAERDAIVRGLPAGSTVDVLVAGVGPAAAAAATAWHLARGSAYTLVVSAGIGGGIGVEPGVVTVAARSVAADLGADSPDGFIGLDELGFGETSLPATPVLPGRITGAILTVTTVTGTEAGLRALRRRHPDAVAEGMEGFGVACAARLAGVPFAEVRAISNPVGPRDRAAWRIRDALDALSAAATDLATVEA